MPGISQSYVNGFSLGPYFLLHWSSFLIIYLLVLSYITSQPQFSLLSPLPDNFSSSSFNFSNFLQKRLDSHGYQPRMAYQFPVRLDTSYCIKGLWGNPVQGKQSQKHAKESETVHTVRNPTGGPSYTTVMYMQRA